MSATLSTLAALPAERPDDKLPDTEQIAKLRGWVGAKNIAEELDDTKRESIAARVKREFDIDDETRGEWKKRYGEWLKFAMQVTEAKSYPWPGASNVIYPLITTAAIQFAARAYPAIVRDKNVVKGTVVGDDSGTPLPPRLAAAIGGAPQNGQPAQAQQAWLIEPGAKLKRAQAIGRHMSWQLLNEQKEWEEQTDRLLIVLPIVGTMFRKTYFDPGLKRNVSEIVDALRLCVNYKAKSFATAPRLTEEIDLYPWEIEERIRAGLFLDVDYGVSQEANQDEDAPLTFLEQHRRYDLDEDGYAEPYVVTIAKDSGRLARIAAGFDLDGVMMTEDGEEIQSIEPIAYYTKFGFVPSPDGGVYDIGFGNLLYPLNDAINSSLNQLFDAGHLANAGGGFIGSGMSMNTGAVRFQIGEYKIINSPGMAIRENLVPLNFPGPNGTLFSLLQFLVEAGKEVASIKDILTGDLPGANVPGILGLATIQQGLKVFSAIFKRVHRSLKSEYQKLYRLNGLYLPEQVDYRLGEELFHARRADYQDGAGVEPVSDPEGVTDAQQMGRANFLLEFKDDPWCAGQEIRRRAFEAANIPDIDKIIMAQPAPNPEAAALENANQVAQAQVHLKDIELQIRRNRENAEASRALSRDKATEIRDLSAAILNLANARKADSEVDQGWIDLQLQNLKAQMDAISGPGTSPETPTGSPAGDGGPVGGGLPGMAPPPGQPAPVPLPG